ncbi:MAG TPA: hypothetical protein DCR70_07095 [Phycisphaerales bacterium]|nr:hypothetical protein [Phycisphaerales bacterium]
MTTMNSARIRFAVRSAALASLACVSLVAPGALAQTPAPARTPAVPVPASGQAAAPAPAAAPPIDMSGTIDSLPPLSIQPPVLDLGFMAPRIGNKGTVTLTNTGKTPLTIAAVTPSCKCTTTSALAGTVLQPGQSVPLEAALDGASMPQTHRASIRVLVEGYAKVAEIQLRAETAMPVRAVPPIINAVEGKPRQGRFVVESIDKKPFTICAVGGRVPEFIGYNAGDAPRAQYLVKFDLDTWQPEFPAYLAIETDRADCPIFDIWVRSERTIPTSAFRMKDYRVNAGRIDVGGSSDVSLEMEDAGEDILAVESGSPEVQVEMLGQHVDSKVRKVSVRITPKSPREGLLYATLKLYGREKEQPLTMFASVRPKGAAGCIGCNPVQGPPAKAPPAPTPVTPSAPAPAPAAP